MALLHGVDSLAGLGEDVWILWGRKHAVKVRLMETFACCQDLSCGLGRC